MVGADRPGGLLVVFEGIDGCGKSTQADRLAAHLERARPGRPVHRPREPGGTPFGEQVRSLLLHGDGMVPLAETLLYMAARAELYAELILPALSRDEVVVLDRSHYSTAAYQGAGLGVDEALILSLAEAVTGGRAPDRVVLLDLPVERAAARRAGGADRIEGRGGDYFARVAEAYRRYARAEPERFLVVDGEPPAEAVERAVREGLADVL